MRDVHSVHGGAHADACAAAHARVCVHLGGGRRAALLCAADARKRVARQTQDCCSDRPLLVVDVGAGIHGMGTAGLTSRNPSGHPDDSDSLILLGKLGADAEVHAFEANPNKADELHRAARGRMIRNHSPVRASARRRSHTERQRG